MSVATQDIRAMSDEELRAAWAADEDASALAEARRRDALDKRLRASAAIRDEWEEAAYAQYLLADAECRGNLFSAAGKTAGGADEFSLWRHSAADAKRFASEELNEWWLHTPRLSVQAYMRQRARAMRAAREDTTGEAVTDEHSMDAHGRDGLDRDGAGSIRPGHGTGTGQPVRADRRPGEAEDRPATGSVQRGDRTVSIAGEAATGARVAANVDRHMAAGREAAERRLAAARDAVAARGTVAVPSQAPVRPPAKPVSGAFILSVADAWMNKHAWMPDAARHTCVLYVAAQHFRLSDENRSLAWPRNFGRVMLLADMPGSGKTTVMTLMGYMAKPWYASNDSNPTARGLGYRIKDQHVMLCIDECHRLFGPKGTRKPDVVTILNSGYEKNGSTVDGRGGKVNELRTYGAAVMAGKSDIRKSGADELGDLLDRCVAVIDMEKPPEGVELAEIGEDTELDGEDIAKSLAGWAAQEMANTGRFRESFKVACDAAKEDGLRGRAKDIWAPLLATAYLAGPRFLDAARDAAVEFQLNRPVQREDPEQPEEIADPLADLAASLADGDEIPSWG